MGRPLLDSYRVIYDHLRGQVLGGALRPGQRIPSSRHFAAELGVARMTVVRAYRSLLEEGYLESRPGSGTFIAAIAPERLLKARPPAPRPRAAPAEPLPTTGVGALAPHVPALDLFPYALWARLAGRAARSLHGERLAYQDPQGLASLREAIAQHWRTMRGAHFDASQVLVTAGAQNAFHLVGKALARPGDLAAVETPGYPYARQALHAAGLEVVGVPVDTEGMVVAALERLARPPRLIYVTPSHQQPTGAALTVQRRLALLDYARRHGCYLVEDDYDSEFRYAGRPLPVLQSLDTEGRVILISSFSKTLFPALRLGFVCACEDHALQSLVTAQDELLRSVSALDQSILAAFIEEGHYARHLRRMRQQYAQRRDQLNALVEGPAGRRIRDVVDLHWPHTGFSAIGWFRQGRPDLATLRQRAAEQDLHVAFFQTKNPARFALLLGFGSTPPERMPDAIARLSAILR